MKPIDTPQDSALRKALAHDIPQLSPSFEANVMLRIEATNQRKARQTEWLEWVTVSVTAVLLIIAAGYVLGNIFNINLLDEAGAFAHQLTGMVVSMQSRTSFVPEADPLRATLFYSGIALLVVVLLAADALLRKRLHR